MDSEPSVVRLRADISEGAAGSQQRFCPTVPCPRISRTSNTLEMGTRHLWNAQLGWELQMT